ncbi:translation initiation factor IF-2-like [Macaca thibetana thibetana]|uniref:translation initiation factor IF-2-like n=1 Tax=Macaca thibetana thibetana TaxID=257877 RepID=UPI0021BCCC23|nr:translation initiation factor IF-2-like [Macaca thibetana thibetana]
MKLLDPRRSLQEKPPGAEGRALGKGARCGGARGEGVPGVRSRAGGERRGAEVVVGPRPSSGEWRLPGKQAASTSGVGSVVQAEAGAFSTGTPQEISVREWGPGPAQAAVVGASPLQEKPGLVCVGGRRCESNPPQEGPHGPGQVTGQPRVPQELRPQLSWDQPPAEPRLPEPPPSSRRRNWLQTLPDRSRRAHRRRADRDAPRVRAGSDPTRPRSSTAAPQGPRRAVLVPGAALPGRAAHRCKLRRRFRFRSLSTPRGHGKVTLWIVVMASTVCRCGS